MMIQQAVNCTTRLTVIIKFLQCPPSVAEAQSVSKSRQGQREEGKEQKVEVGHKKIW